MEKSDPVVTSQVQSKQKNAFTSNKVLLMSGGVVLLLIVAFFGYKFVQGKQTGDKQTEAAKESANAQLLVAIGKLTILPVEEPTIATVSDKTKLSDQAFFRQAENGDKLLIYSQAKKAILYRPSLKKIVDITIILEDGIGSVAGASTQASGSATASSSAEKKTLTLTILNGTKTSGLAGAIEKEVTESGLGFEVKTKGNAVGDFEKTIVVDISGKYKKEAESLAKLYGASVATLPSDEKAPATDLLLILGKDRVPAEN